jgi:hypothetical protein
MILKMMYHKIIKITLVDFLVNLKIRMVMKKQINQIQIPNFLNKYNCVKRINYREEEIKN